MPETSAGTYAALADIEIVNNQRTLSYLQNGLGPGSLTVHGDCGNCENIYDLLGCFPDEVVVEQCVDLPGLSNNAIATSPLGINSSFSLIIDIELVSWVPVTQTALIAQHVPITDNRAFRWYVATNGDIRLSVSDDGSTEAIASFTNPGFSGRKKLRIDWNDGADQASLYHSDDLENWILLDTQALSRAGVFVSNALVTIGATSNGSTDPADGNVYYAQIRSGDYSDETILATFDPVDTPAPGPRDPSSSGVWNILGSDWEWCAQLADFPFFPFVSEPGYVSPEADEAPWVSPTIPESKEFLGFFVDEFDGLSSPFNRSVTETVYNGGILSRSRLNTRSLTWRGYLFGGTCCGTHYGLRWLAKTLSRFDSSCRDCFGDDLELLVCCPCEDQTGVEAFRTLKGVGLLEGPTIVSQRKTVSSGCTTAGCSGSCIIEVEFTLVATQPYLYSAEVPVYDCVSIFDDAVFPFTEAELDCGPSNCSDILFDPELGLCPVSLPPTASYSDACLTPNFLITQAQYFTVPRSLWGDLEEVVPVITIRAGEFLTQFKIGFYSSASGNPCGDLAENPPNCDVVCDELAITIPASSTFYIDGRTRKMSLICPDGSVFAGERLTNGPWSWPVFSCYGFCMEVLFDSGQTTAAGSCLSLSLVPRTF